MTELVEHNVIKPQKVEVTSLSPPLSPFGAALTVKHWKKLAKPEFDKLRELNEPFIFSAEKSLPIWDSSWHKWPHTFPKMLDHLEKYLKSPDTIAHVSLIE